jgi:hypothetical protein
MLWLSDVYSLSFLRRAMVEGEGGGVYCYFLSISCSASNIGLCVSICVSFMCRFSLLVLYIWYLSNVLRCVPFLPVVITSIVSVITPYAYPVFNMWFEYPEILLLLLMSCKCSLYLVLNQLTNQPTNQLTKENLHYRSVHDSHWLIHLLWYASICRSRAPLIWLLTLINFLLHADFLLCFFFNSEDGGDIFPPKRRLTFDGLQGIISSKIEHS